MSTERTIQHSIKRHRRENTSTKSRITTTDLSRRRERPREQINCDRAVEHVLGPLVIARIKSALHARGRELSYVGKHAVKFNQHVQPKPQEPNHD